MGGGGSKKLKGGLKFKKGKCVGAQKTSGVSKLKKVPKTTRANGVRSGYKDWNRLEYS